MIAAGMHQYPKFSYTRWRSSYHTATARVTIHGDIVMAQACTQLAAWREQGLRLVQVSINVSPKQ
jgi:EAL domain-containing protein (putative c-di-GMP-specific phosphodiesterase class I)